LAEDVLAQQSQEVRDFLLRTSILRTLDAQVCQALAPRSDCPALLARLEAAHLFLSPLGDDARSYRYHSLFADFLRAQLQRERPEEFARLHLAASGWYEAAGRPVPAIEHALQGGDPPHALHLLAQHAEALLEQGRMRLLARWLGTLPPALLADQPLLQAVAVCAHCFTHGAWQAQRQLDASTACLASTDPAVQAHVNALRPLLLAMMDRVEEALPAGRAALARLPTCRPFADNTLTNAMAYVVSLMGEPDEAHRLLDAARRTQGGSLFSRMYTEAMEGVLDLAEGRRRQAAARFRVALAATPRAASYNPTHGNAWAGVLHAGMLYESNDLAGADHLLNVYLPLARDVGLPDHVIASYRMRARIAFLRGDVDAAFGLLTELEYIGQQRQLPRVTASARLELARIFTLQGNRQAAAEALARADDAAVWPRVQRLRFAAHEVEDIAIGRLRWTLRFGSAEAARALLTGELAALRDEAASRGRRHRELKLGVLAALAESRAGQQGAALNTLAAVLHPCSREGFMRLLLDEGPALCGLLRRLQARLRQAESADPLVASHVAQLLAASGEAEDVAADADNSVDADRAAHHPRPWPAAASAADARVPPAPLAPPAGAAIETLTRKELRVLELLAAGYSNAAMAEKLFVSDSTVRTHLRNINAKLGARSRTQAVALARGAGVLR
ncbi:MAG: helix-turn-helix transcriptional regulator, partial [Comamonadaceae bacterium]